MVTVTFFYDGDEGFKMDVDNIPKPIVDALEGLAFLEDRQLTDLICRKRDLRRNLRTVNASSVVVEGLGRGGEFLHVVVEEAPDQEVIA